MRSVDRESARQGFALIVTIALMAFILLLMLSLASLTRVQMQVASHEKTRMQARENALLALSLAMGQLQVLAGPDQRATATAELSSTVQDGNRYWTGVWGNENASAEYKSSPKLLSWLVSGNDNTTFSVDRSATSYGRILNASKPTYSLEDIVDLGNAMTDGPLADNVSVKGQHAAVLMGPGSVDDSADCVVAPLVDIQEGSVVTGRYAWWVGDEGVKARLNLLDSWEVEAHDTQERFNRIQVGQRHGIELFQLDENSLMGDEMYNVDSATQDGMTFREALLKVDDYTGAAMLPGFEDSKVKEAMQSHRHDLTTVSQGVLADQLRGGLRYDLTVLMDTDSSQWSGTLRDSLEQVSFNDGGTLRIADFESAKLYSEDYSMVSFVTPDSRTPKAATWEQVQSYYDYASSNTGVVGASPSSLEHMPVYPIVQRWGITFDVSANADGSGGTLHLFPFVVLWNPYNVALQGSYRVRMEFADKENSTLTRYYLVTPQLDGDGIPISSPPYTVYFQDYIAGLTPGTGKYSDRTMEFQIRPVTIPAGEAYVFSPETTAAYQDSGDNWLSKGYSTTQSFTRPIAHTFTPEEVEYTAIAVGNIDGGNGGTMSLHLLDESGAPLQLIDAVSFGRRVTVDANDGTATQVTAVNSSGLNDFRDVTLSVSSRNQVGFSGIHSLQRTDSRQNWLAHINQRAPSIGRSWLEWGGGVGTTPNWTTTSMRADSSLWRVDEDPAEPGRTYTGPNHGPSFATTSSPSAVKEAILFNIPQVDTPLLSLGQFQHAVLTSTPSGNEPTYPFGNAYAPPRIQQEFLMHPNRRWWSATGEGSEAHLTDVSYLLNRALWDRFFFSGTPDVSAAELQVDIEQEALLPNGHLRYYNTPSATVIRGFDSAASGLVIEGAFNVNSASVDAWAALLGSLRGVKVDPASGAELQSMSGSPFVRTPKVTGGSHTNSAIDQWAGYRNLSDSEIRMLAQAMRDEVLARGPFLSIADFVNRRLVTYPDETGLRGTLQAAIDETNLNTAVLEQDRPDGGNSSYLVPEGNEEIWELNGVNYYKQNVLAPRSGSSERGRSKSAMAPGFLTQADILQVLGPGIAARSDTFTIRAYGETINPLSGGNINGDVTSRAWCEAVVQRIPEYVDGSDPAETPPVTGTVVNLSEENQRFGRRFKIVSFRWLDPNEI